MIRRSLVIVLATIALFVAPGARPASACFTGQLVHPSANGLDFKVAQVSQGGNFYYGTAGVMSPAPPPDPTTPSPPYGNQHVNSNFASSDARFANGATPGVAHVGWAYGYHSYNNTTFTTPTAFAETFAYSSSPILAAGGAVGAGVWYKTQLTGSTPGGAWHYDTYYLVSGAWARLGGGVDLTTSTTESQAFGEISDPGIDSTNQANEQCRTATGAGGARNSFGSLQLFVDNAAWQNWEAVNGRWGCASSERPYRPDPATINADCTQGTFWDRQYTDFSFWGP